MEIQEKDGIKVVRFPNACVSVIVYTLENGVLKDIGVVKEKNPHFQNGFTENIVMGSVEAEDTSLLERAMIELKQEAGIEVLDSLKWSFLGEIYTSKISPDPIYLFSVNVTGASIGTPTGDGTETEKILSFDLVPASEALKNGDSVMLSAFFKLFMQIYQKEIKTN